MHWFLNFMFGMKLYMFWTVPLSIMQEFFTVHTAVVYVIQVCWQLVSRSICSCSQAVFKPVWHIPWLCVQWKTPDDRQRNCPKHVEFHSKNKIEKLMHLVGFFYKKCDLSPWFMKFILPFLHVVMSCISVLWFFFFNFEANQLNDVQFSRNNYTNN